MTKKAAAKKQTPSQEDGSGAADTSRAKAGERKAIQVARLEILERNYVDVGLKGFESSEAHTLRASDRIQIEYRPWMRHHVVTFQGVQTMIHETWCHWQPL